MSLRPHATVPAAATAVMLLLPHPTFAKNCSVDRLHAVDRFTQCRHRRSCSSTSESARTGSPSASSNSRPPGRSFPAAGRAFTDNGDGTGHRPSDQGSNGKEDRRRDRPRRRQPLHVDRLEPSGRRHPLHEASSRPTNQAGACFTGYCDWRLPTPAELQSIQAAAFPSCTGTCIDSAVFGPVSGLSRAGRRSSPTMPLARGTRPRSARRSPTSRPRTTSRARRARRGAMSASAAHRAATGIVHRPMRR